MSHRNEYTALNDAQRRIARKVAKTGVAAPDEGINRAAWAWARRRASSGVEAVLVFLLFAIAYFFMLHNVPAGEASLAAMAATVWLAARDLRRLAWLRGQLGIDSGPANSEPGSSGADHSPRA
jgi:hypothetical protein